MDYRSLKSYNSAQSTMECITESSNGSQQMSNGNNDHGSQQSPNDNNDLISDTSNDWGFYEDEFDVTTKSKTANSEIRDAWLKLSYNMSSESNTNKPNDEKNENENNIKKDDEPYGPGIESILNVWINPNPELSIKSFVMEEEDAPLTSMDYMNMTCCVSGFRIVQLKSGECIAQYNCIFCYGSRTFSSWKSPSEFKSLASIVKYIHGKDDSMFPETMHIWKLIETYEKWYVCLRAPYLIEKSIALGSFIQSLFAESPTPGLLVCFIQQKNFSVD